MTKKEKTAVIIAASAVALWLAWRWYRNRQAGSSTGLGTNLNSSLGALVAGSSGPSSGLNYYAGSTSITVSEPVTQSSQSTVTYPAPSPSPSPSPPPPPPRRRPPWHWWDPFQKNLGYG